MASLQEMRAGNRIRLLQSLRQTGEADRAELARLTGLSRATVSGLVGEAIARGHVVERAGRPATLRLEPRAGLFAGVDLGHSHVAVVLADLGGAIVGERRVALDVDAAPQHALDVAAGLLGEVVGAAEVARERLVGVALGIPGPLERRTGAQQPASVVGRWAGQHPGAELARRIDRPVRVENDANLGMLGEHFQGAAQGVRDAVYLKLSTGAGAGLLLDGALYVGARGLAGELGHVTVLPSGHICRCGNRGCLETVASASALAGADRGALRDAGRHVARALAPLCLGLDLQMAVIGGELGAASPELVGAVRSELRRMLPLRGPVTVRAGSLGDRAEVLGAVALALGQEDWLRRAGLIALGGGARHAIEDVQAAPSDLRAGNVATVVQALRQHRTSSRTDLARVTGLSRTTVLSILDQLEGSGFVAVRGGDEPPARSPGRPALRFALQPSAGVALGIFVGREHLEVVVADLSQRVLAGRRERFDHRPAAQELVDLALDLAESALDEAGIPAASLVGTALAVPSPIDPATGEADPRILEDWSSTRVRETIRARLGTPVRIENDADVEALAELGTGAGRDLRHALYVHVGYGIGGAVVLDGRLHRGRTGTAGELAHIRVRGGAGPRCLCGRRDCLRAAASGWALLHALAVTHGRELTLHELLTLSAAGDPGARRAMTDAGDALGGVLAGLCTVINPQAVIIGGDLGFAGSPLVDAARRRVDADVHPTIGPVEVLPAALGALGGGLGAAGVVARSGDLFRHRIALG